MEWPGLGLEIGSKAAKRVGGVAVRDKEGVAWGEIARRGGGKGSAYIHLTPTHYKAGGHFFTFDPIKRD